MLKFKLSGHGAAAGTVLALPRSVWDSWQPFLGAPALDNESTEVLKFDLQEEDKAELPINSYICVFDLDSKSEDSISPARIQFYIRVSPERLSHYAFTVVPDNIMNKIRDKDSILSRVKERLSEVWPDLERKVLL